MRRHPGFALGALVALAVAAAWAALAVWGFGGAAPRLAPLGAPDLGVVWSPRVVFAETLRDRALTQLLRVLAVFCGIAAIVALGSFAFRMSQ